MNDLIWILLAGFVGYKMGQDARTRTVATSTVSSTSPPVLAPNEWLQGWGA